MAAKRSKENGRKRFHFLDLLLPSRDGATNRDSQRRRVSPPFSRRHRPRVEPLESRLLLTLDVSLDGGNLLLREIGSGSDTLQVGYDSVESSYVFTDSTKPLTTSIAAASGGGTNTVKVPASLITGDISLATGDGDDVVTVASSFELVTGRSVSLDLGVGSDSIDWKAESTLDSLTVDAEQTQLSVPFITTSGVQTWNTSLQVSIATTLSGDGVVLQDVDLGQKDLIVSSQGDIEVSGSITNGGSGEIDLEAEGGISIGSGQIVTNAGSIIMTALSGGIAIDGAEIVSGSGEVDLRGTSHSGHGLAIRNSTVETSANGTIYFSGVGAAGGHGILIEGTTQTKASVTTSDRDITLLGNVSSGDGHGIFVSDGLLSARNGTLVLTGTAAQSSIAGSRILNSDLLMTGSGDISLSSGNSIVQFGAGDNAFNLDFVNIGNAGNSADTTGTPNPAGAVAYEYQIGKYEISRGMIDAYNAAYGTANGLAITMQTSYGALTPERAASGISWNEAARFVNWLNTSQGYSAAYKFTTDGVNDNIALWNSDDAGYDATNPYRNSNAVYVLPTVDEWYKAAYYDPSTGTWREYASLDGKQPAAVSSGTADNTAVYGNKLTAGPADITLAGGLNAHGLMGLSGNVWEWEESSFDLQNTLEGSDRGIRGGAWAGSSSLLSSLSRFNSEPQGDRNGGAGFRVGSLLPTVKGKVEIEGSTLQVNGGTIDIDGSLQSINSTLASTTGFIQVGGEDSTVYSIGSTVTTETGNIYFFGDGATTGLPGIELVNSTVSGTTTGTIFLSGIGGAGESGVKLQSQLGGTSLVTTFDGSVTLEGFGGTLGGVGIELLDGTVKSTGSGNLGLYGVVQEASTPAISSVGGKVLSVASGSVTLDSFAESQSEQTTGTPQTGEILLNRTTVQANTGELSINAENIKLQGQETIFVVGGADQIITSNISGTGHLRKLGPGQLTLNGNVTTSAYIYVRRGTLLVDGQVSGHVLTEGDANGAGTLGGTGTILGSVTANGSSVIAPGGTAGILYVGNLNLTSNASFQFEFGSTTAGNGSANHDQIVVTGDVTLAGSFDVTLTNNFTPSIGDSFTLIDNDGTDAVSGTFSGLAEGDLFASSGYSWQISYVGGTGNDVTLTRLGSVFDVNNLNLSGTGSLAQAILDANATTGGDWIRILTSGILPVTAAALLPEITDQVIIDGTTATDYADSPTFEIRGTDAGTNSGLIFASTASLSELLAVSVTDFGLHGVEIAASEVTVTGSWLGVTAAGEALGNTAGLHITGDSSVIGGLTSDLRNVISGNQLGIYIHNGNANSIIGNDIGTDAAGETDLGNTLDGIKITAGSQNVIGGNSAGARNVISGNDSSGIRIEGAATVGTIIQGNYIGVGTNGEAISNGGAIAVINSASETLIGGTGTGEGNVIASSVNQGIYLTNAPQTTVQGNWIGTNPSGDAARPNLLNGIYLGGDVTGTVIGGAGGANVISGNGLSGISVDRVTGGVQILSNLIGTTGDGEVALPNNDGVTVKADNVTIGGTSAADQNTISGNTRDGIRFLTDASLQNTGNVVQGNLIGLKESGLAALGNGAAGVYVSAANVTIGGSSSVTDGLISGAGNVIGGNAAGITVAASNATIQGNYIGADPAGTTAIANGVGITVEATGTQVTIGGSSSLQNATLSGEGNLISGNTGSGIEVNADDAVIEGNYIGVDVTGVAALVNGVHGVDLKDGDRLRVGNSLDADFSTLTGRGNLISGNTSYGINVSNAVGLGSSIVGNYIGTDVTGTAAIGNDKGLVSSATELQIGGLRNDTSGRLSGFGNLISGNDDRGIWLLNASGNEVQGNFIGTDVTGQSALVNGLIGVAIGGGAGNVIGTDGDAQNDTLEGNLISGNASDGVKLYEGVDGVVAGNRIGTNFDGTVALPNASHGVFVQGGSGHQIGTDADGTSDAAEGNLISGNLRFGVLTTQLGAETASGMSIAGNKIGTDLAGTTSIANQFGGVQLGNGSSSITIGGTTSASRNIISGNVGYGLRIIGPTVSQHVVQGNYIGVDSTGAAALGNSLSGIYVDQAGGNTIGGPGEAYRNVISGNLQNGILVSGSGADDNKVQGNYIGTSADGTADLGNAGTGVVVTDYALRTVIGTDADGANDAAEGNLISGNDAHGVHVARSLDSGLALLDSILAGELSATTATSTITTADLMDSNHLGASGNWSHDNAIPGGGGDFFFVRSLGQINVTTSGDFSFALGGDDGGRLLIDGTAVIVDDSFHEFDNKYATVNLKAGLHDFEWVGQEGILDAGFELSVAVGANRTTDVTEKNGWKVLGAASPHAEIALEGSIAVTAYYQGVLESGTTIAGNQVGTDVSGLVALGNIDRGIFSQDSVISVGGTTSTQRNVISGNGTDGVTLQGWVPATAATSFTGNYVGVGVDGETAVPNAWAGIALAWNDIQVGGSSSLSSGTLTGAGNVISGNGNFGIWSNPSGVWANTASQNAVVQGNLIGTDATGTKAVANGIGIVMSGAGHLVGGSSSEYRNTISGNAGEGIVFSGVTDGQISGNYIGVNASGNLALGNGLAGVLISGGSSNVIGTDGDGTSDASEGNVISGNTTEGIKLLLSSGETIAGNFIGTNAAGDAALPNYDGISVTADSVQIGGTTSTLRNIISGNTRDGIRFLTDDSLDDTGNTVLGNFIGLGATGLAALGNGAVGVNIAAPNVTIGGSSSVTGGVIAGSGNVISGNATGINVSSANVTVQGNYVGTDLAGANSVGNAIGIAIQTAGTSATIGGSSTLADGNLSGSGNLVSGNTSHGIEVYGDDAVLEGNYVGVDVTGGSRLANEGHGVYLRDGDRLRVGKAYDQTLTTLTGRGNLISGNSLNGINALSTVGTGSSIVGNYVGVNVAGSSAIANGTTAGVSAIAISASNMQIGSTSGFSGLTGGGNLVSGSLGYGIELLESASSNLIQGNYIGTDVLGTTAVANAYDGIYVAGSSNTIGGTSTGQGNLISGNTKSGVLVDGGDDNAIYGNRIGTNVSGTAGLANGENGILVTGGTAGTLIGSGVSGARNLISGHSLNGVFFNAAGTGNRVQGNYIGTTASGAIALPNATNSTLESAGVKIYDVELSSVTVGTNGDGTADSAEGNLISGNSQSGILIVGVSSASGGHVIAGNSIGVNAGLNVALPNQGHGVVVKNSNDNRIGSNGDGVSDSAEANQIAGNRNASASSSADYRSGILVIDDTSNDANFTEGNVIAGNAIGTDRAGEKPIPNQGNGISIVSATSTVVGGSGVPNLIRFNELAGLRITGDTDSGVAADRSTSLLANSFQANEGLPVDLGNVGQNLNSDSDSVLDFPVFTSAAITDGVMSLEGYIEAGTVFDLYLNAGRVGQEFGDGLTWVASFTEGSSDDLDNATGSYGPDVRGVTVADGELTRNKFRFDFALPAGVNNGVQLTGIASQNGISEFTSLILAGELASVVAPEITLENSSDPVLVNELVEMSVDGSFYDPDSKSWTATVDYGDGSGAVPLALSAARTFTLANIYDTPGSYTVTVQIVDSSLAVGTAQFDVTVANVAPDVDFSAFDFTSSANEGDTVSLSGAFLDGNTAHVVEITWGDSTTTTLNLDAGTQSFSTTHVYSDDTNSAGSTTASDVYSVDITIRDATETTGTDSSDGMFLTEISNVRPTLDSVLFNGSTVASGTSIELNEGSTLALVGAFTDPGVDDVHNVRVDWGDGTITQSTLTTGDRTFSGLSGLSHVYVNDSSTDYTVTIELWDDDEPALRTEYIRTVTVSDVSPSDVTLDVVPASVSEGGAIQISGTFVDPGNQDAHQVTVTWGDGTPDTIVNLAAGVTSFSGSDLSHTYADNRTSEAEYTISVVVSDLADESASGTGTATVGVLNVAPVAGSLSVTRADGTSGSISEGQRVTVVGSYTDVSPLDRHQVTITWGDGTTSNATVDATNRTFTASHQYLDNYDAAEIYATIIDGRYVSGSFVADGGQDTSSTVTQVITNVAPTPTIAPVAGSTPTVTKLVAEVVDPGTDDLAELTYQWQISDGLSYNTVATTKTFTFDSTSYSQPLIRLIVSDDDGGVGQDDVVAIFGTDAAETISITDTGATITNSGGSEIPIASGVGGWLDRILVLGFGGADTLDASELSEDYTAILDGGQELDYLFGGAGEDVFYPNDGNDYVSGGAGDDNYVLTPNSTLTVLDISGSNTLDFSRTEFGDTSGVTFDLTAIRTSFNLADFNPAIDTQLVSTANGTNHEVAAFGNFTTLLGSSYGDNLTIGSGASVDSGAGADTINLGSNTSNATVSGGADNDILLVSGTNITELTFSGDDGLDILRNVGEITGLTFGGGADSDLLENTGSILGTLNFGGDDGVDVLTNTGTIGGLVFNGGADNDIFINNGTETTTLDFGGDQDILLSGVGTVGSLTFGGDDGADIFANLGSITELTFTGGADNDVFINVGTSSSLNFGGDSDVLLSNTSTVGTIGTLIFSGDDGADIFGNYGEITTLTFNGGADNDVLTNYAGATLTSLTFGGDDGLDVLQNAGVISGLTFSGGADNDTLLNTVDGSLSSLVFGGDDGSDVLTNYGLIDGLTFSGGADSDILTNVGTISSSLVFGGDDGVDSLLNTGDITSLTFGGGADDDILTNYSNASITSLNFGGDDGIDTLTNYGDITSLDFGGGADADVLVNGLGGQISNLFFGGDYEPDGVGGFTPIGSVADNGADVLGNYGSITELLFRGGADNDSLINYDTGSLGTLNFGGDDGLDTLRNDGTVTALTFGGGADSDTLINNGTVTGPLVFGGDQQFSSTDQLEQITTASDDGADTLANYGTLAGLTFTGGADNDILLNAATGTVSSLVFSGDDGADILQNLGAVTELTFTGGADNDTLVNKGSGITTLVFSGDDGADILRNEGTSITALTFTGGADDDVLLNTASTITALTFSGGADNDVLQNTGDSIATLSFTGDAGLDVLLNTGSSITSLTFGGGADNDTLRSTGDDIGVIIFGGDIDSDTGEPTTGTNGGNDTLIVSGSGTGASNSRILFTGDDGIDAFQNDATDFTSITFNGGADNDVFLNNASSIGGLIFNGGADNDVLENNGSSISSLVFSGDDGADTLYNTGNSLTSLVFTGGADADVLLNTGDSVSGIVFSGDDGADILSNTGADLTSLTFTGGADKDVFLNTGANLSGINFSGDAGADIFWNKSTGINASSLTFSGGADADILVNDAAGVSGIVFTGGADNDAFQNSGVSLSGLVFSGGADNDTLLNTSTGSILSLSFGGDDGNDTLQTVGAVTSLTFGGGADADTLNTQGIVDTLVFMGDGELDDDGNLVQISVAADDGIDTLLNEATVTSLTFTGGADNDVFVNNNTVGTLTFSGGADNDTLQNNALVTSLVFTGGADDDMLINNASSMPTITFYGDDGVDTLINNGNNLTELIFEGGADADVLRVHGTGIGNLTFTGGADAAADTFHFRATAATGSTISFLGGDGADVFAWRGTADSATFDAGAGNDTAIIQGSGALSLIGGDGDDSYLFEADPAASVSITETWSGADDTSSDTLDFSSFTGGALTLDLRSTSTQNLSSNLSLTLSDSRGIENVIGTSEADTIYGNLQNNTILGAEYSSGYGAVTAGDRGVTQWVLLDFDTYTGDGEHVYTTDERDQITSRVENLYRGTDSSSPLFDVRVVQTRGEIPVADGQFVVISFNDTPAFGRPGGLASEIDPGNLNLGGTAVVQVNGLLGGTITSEDSTGEGGGDEGADKGFLLRQISDDPVGVSKPDATSENFVLLSAKIAAHELAHLMGLRHQDSFGPIGLGIHDPPGIEGYNPIFPGPVGAVETFDHLLGTGASVGSDRFNDLRDLFFSERSAMKLALATADTADVFTVESSTAHSTSATAQVLPLVTVDVPNTLTTGLNADKVFYVQMQSVEGTIEIDPVTGQSENDWYSFTGTAGDTMNIELFSNSLIRYGTGNDNYIDSILRVWYEVSGTMTLVPWFGSEAVNDDIFEPTDSALIDLVLPADGVYYIEVDTFKRDPSSEVFDATSATSPLNPDNPNNYLSHPDLLDRFLSTRDDTDIGNYQLVVSRFDRSNSSDGVDTIVGYGGTDTIDAGDGDDYSLVVTVGSDASLNEGGTLTRTISLVDRAATDWSTSTVDYGDGGGATPLTVASDKTAALSYTYADSGTYTVSVTIRDDIGQVSNETFDVTVANVAPVVVTLTGDQTPDEGTTQTYSFTASDVGDDTFSVVEISGGDYGTVSNIAINSVTGSGSFDVTYADITSATAANTLSVKLKDSDDAESNVLTLAVTVQNVGTGPSDLSLSASTIEENAASGTSIGTFTTTDSASGGSYTYTLVAGTGDTDNALFSISGDTLLSAATFDYEVATSRSIRVRTTDGSGNTYDKAFTISVTDVADETAPSSSIAALAADSTTASLSISVSGSDAGTSASGVSSYALYYSVGASWILFDTVTPASPNSTFQANPNTLYWFRSVATDAAGNVETKSTSDTYTRVGDVTVPTSEVSSATAADSGLITLAITGEKSNGRPITTFDVYMSVDGAAYEKVASVNSTEVSNGVFSGAATVQGIVDGASHQYAFYTRAIDGNAKTEDAPASADQTITATFSGASLTAQGIDVQKGANSRSYIRNVDLLFSADPTELLDAGRIEVEQFSLSAGEGSVAAGTGTAITVSGKSVSGNSLELDFGTLGIGGRWWLGDGFYRIMVDMNNDGNVAGPEDAIFEFYRLFGDANGDGVVNPSDDLVIRSQMNRSGANLDGDVDGSGRVNGRDRLFARRRYNQAIPAWMNDWLDD